MSTSIVALVNFALLMILMRRKLGRIGGRHLSQTFGKICLASFAMAIVVWLVNWQVGVHLPLKGTLLRLVQVSSAIAAGALSFYFLCRMLRVQELDEAIGSLGGRLLNRRRSR
jgi:putative peptidoglycan lipid II flippase